MSDLKNYKLTKNEAEERINAYEEESEEEFRREVERWAGFDIDRNSYDSVYKDIRSAVVDAFKTSLKENGNSIGYNLDLKVGMALYDKLFPIPGGMFNVVKASNDDIWRYISVCVMPDLTFLRYPNRPEDVRVIKKFYPDLSYSGGISPEKGSNRMKRKRFYSQTRRIWLKSLWWYIHLSWQGSAEQTLSVLEDCGTDMIGHLIERPGRGYRVNLFRCMMSEYSKLSKEQKNNETFKAATKLNHMKCLSVEPILTEGGERAYSERLFKEVLGNDRL